MSRQFYRLSAGSDHDDEATWLVDDYEMADFDQCDLWDGRPLGTLDLTGVELRISNRIGPPPDLLVGPVSWHVHSRRVVDVLQSVAGRDVEIFPAPLVANDTRAPLDQHRLVNIARTVDCLDRAHSEVMEWEGGGDETVFDPVVEPSRIPPDAHVFRIPECLSGWTSIWSSEVVDAIREATRDAPLIGMSFELCVAD